jgi:hypothetical protein
MVISYIYLICWCMKLVFYERQHTPGCTAPGDAVPAPQFPGVVDPRVTGLGLSGSLSSLPSPVDWGQVEDSLEQACSQFAAADILLWEALAVVDQDIRHPSWVSLEKKNGLPESLLFL